MKHRVTKLRAAPARFSTPPARSFEQTAAIMTAGHAVDDSRGTGGDDGRGGTLPPPPTLPSHTNLYGFFGSPSIDINFTNEDGNAFWSHSGQSAGGALGAGRRRYCYR